MTSTQRQHEMVLEEIYPSGTEEWYCPLCDRRVLIMCWHPDGKQILINDGDKQFHSTTEHKDLLGMVGSDEVMISAEDEVRLKIWKSWLINVKFDSWWND